MLTETYATIVSRSGMTHIVRPVPAHTITGASIVEGKTQTFCEMHIKPEDVGTATGRSCEFCPPAVEDYERRLSRTI